MTPCEKKLRNLSLTPDSVDWAKDALFDGALLFDGGDAGSREAIACFMHEGDRLGIVWDRGEYFRAEFLQKQPCRTFSAPLWSKARLSTICGRVTEGEALIKEFLVQSS